MPWGYLPILRGKYAPLSWHSILEILAKRGFSFVSKISSSIVDAMKKPLHTIGRIFLLVAGILFIFRGVAVISQSVNDLNALGWQNAFKDWALARKTIELIGGVLNILVAAVAFFGVIRGKKSFKLALFAISLIIPPTLTIVSATQIGAVFDWDFAWKVISAYSLSLLYFLGFLFL